MIIKSILLNVFFILTSRIFFKLILHLLIIHLTKNHIKPIGIASPFKFTYILLAFALKFFKFSNKFKKTQNNLGFHTSASAFLYHGA